MICRRVVTEAAYRARRLVGHIGRGIVHHAALHPVVAIVSVVCVGAPAAMLGLLPVVPAAPAVARDAARYAPAPDWAADKWWQDRADYLPAPTDDIPDPDASTVPPDAVSADAPRPTDVPAPAMGWIVLVPLAFRRLWK